MRAPSWTSCTSMGFFCLVDQFGSDAGASLSARFLRSLARCRMLVLVGSEGATRSSAVAQEVEVFASARGTHRIAPIGFTGVNWEGASWYPKVEGLDRRTEPMDALTTVVVDPEILTWLERRFQYAKGKDRLRVYRNGALGAIGSLIALSVSAGWYTTRALTTANEASGRVRAARAEAERQEAIAGSRDLANRAGLLLDEGPRSLPEALRVSVEAVRDGLAGKSVRTLESDMALRRSLSFLPRLREARAIVGRSTDLAFSPDGKLVARLDQHGSVRVFRPRQGEAIAVGKIPRLSNARLVAVSDRAAVLAMASHREVLAFDVAKQRGWRFHAPEDEDVDALALAPSGRYLAVVFSSAVTDHSPKLGRMSLIDLQKRLPIAHLAGELDMSINDVTFDATGTVLAVGGADRTDWTSGLVAFWDLGSRCDEVEGLAEPDVAAAMATSPGGIDALSGKAPLLARVKGNVTALAVSANPWIVAVADESEVTLWQRSPGGGGGFEPVRFLPLRFEARELVIENDSRDLALIEMQEPSDLDRDNDDNRSWSYSAWDLAADPTRICLAMYVGRCARDSVGDSSSDEPADAPVPALAGMPMVRPVAEPARGRTSFEESGEAISWDGARRARIVDGRLAVRDVASGDALASIRLAKREAVLERVTFSPQGRYLAVLQDGSLSVFSVAGAKTVALMGHAGCGDYSCTNDVAFSWDESRIAVASEDGAATILELRDRQSLEDRASLSGPSTEFQSGFPSPGDSKSSTVPRR